MFLEYLWKTDFSKTQGTKQTENFHLIRDEYGHSAGTDSVLPYLQKETPPRVPDFALSGEEKEKNHISTGLNLK